MEHPRRPDLRRDDHEAQGSSERAGTAAPISLVDLDGAVTRIAPFGAWTREQVRLPDGEARFVTSLDRGQLWHTAGEVSTWAHEVRVGPATVSSRAGRFHAVAEPDGGATITCLGGHVAVSTKLHDPVRLEPDEAVAVAADGETCVVIDAASLAPRSPNRPPAAGPVSGQATNRAGRVQGAETGGNRPSYAGRRVALIALIAALGMSATGLVATWIHQDDARSSTSPRRSSTERSAEPRSTAPPRTTVPRRTTGPSRPTAPPRTSVPVKPPAAASAAAELDTCAKAGAGVLAGGRLANTGAREAAFTVHVTLFGPAGRVLGRGTTTTPIVAPGASTTIGTLISGPPPPAGAHCEVGPIRPG